MKALPAPVSLLVPAEHRWWIEKVLANWPRYGLVEIPSQDGVAVECRITEKTRNPICLTNGKQSDKV